MTETRMQGLKPTSQIQQDIRKNALKKVARLLNDYYQSIQQAVTQEDLKKETFSIVKEMDQIATKEARDEADYNAIMNNQYNIYKQHLTNKRKEITATDPVMMATVMINSLQKLQDFMDHTEFQPHDFQLIQQLIQFIKSIPSDNFGVHISQADQIEAIKVYYEKLFIPIQKTIENQQQQFSNPMMQAQQNANQNQMAANQQQQMMQQMIQQGMQPPVQQPMQQPMQQLMQQQQQMQHPQITPSMSQQIPSPNQDINTIPRQMPVPNPQNPMSNALQPQPSQGQKHPGLSVPMQPQVQAQQSSQQMQQQIQQIQIQQQPSAQQLQQVQQHQNPRSPQQKTRTPHPMTATSPQMMQQVQQQQQQMHGMNMPVNQMQPPQPIQPQAPPSQHPMQGRQQAPVDNSEIIKQLFQNVRGDCAVFYSTPHPPHF